VVTGAAVVVVVGMVVVVVGTVVVVVNTLKLLTDGLESLVEVIVISVCVVDDSSILSRSLAHAASRNNAPTNKNFIS